MSNDSISREALTRIVNLVKPALSTQDYMPALKHILFADGYATAFNDATGIQVTLPHEDLDLDLCLPGDMLSRTLNSFNAEKVLLQPNDKDGSLVVASGRARIKLKTLPKGSHPFELPKGKAADVTLSDDMLAGIRRCLISVGNNPSHPAGMGVTLDQVKGKATLYSTDNATISRYATKDSIELPGDSPVIMPTFFCEQLVSLARAFPKAEVFLRLYAGAVMAVFEQGSLSVARLVTKTLSDASPLDFPRIVAKHVDVDKASGLLVKIPAAFDSAFDRALLVLGSEVDKHTKVSHTDAGVKLVSTSDAGEASDAIEFEDLSEHDDRDFNVDPTLVARACKTCGRVGFFNRVMVFADDEAAKFLHLVAHSSV